MSWSSGSFTRIFGATGWTDDKNAATFILASRHDTHDQDLADGINACITRDNQAKPTASFLPNADGTLDLGAVGTRWKDFFMSGNITVGGTLTTPNTSASEPGFKGIPQNDQKAGSYSCVLADAGKHIVCGNTFTYTIPANASVAYPIGTVLTFLYDSTAGSCTIAITSDTMILSGTALTGSRTLSSAAIATAIKKTATTWYISGAGVS